MMEQFLLDPYEQQLLKVFDSHDRDNCGSLDKDGLLQLCQTLQLEEQGSDLVKCLLNEKHSRATFIEFKDALLALLGNMQQKQRNQDDTTTKNNVEKSSPEREVSPKFVYGSKKYGRRSRPRNDDTDTIVTDLNVKSPTNNSVQRSNSQTEVSNSKKRKTNYKLKRCLSLPGNNSYARNYESTFITSPLASEPETICTEEMLREAWKKLGVGKDGFLNQHELVLVFDEIGLHKLADSVIRQLSDKLTLNYDHKISFTELLEALQQDETWFDLLNSSPTKNNTESLIQTNDFPDSRTFQYVTLGPDGNGFINTDSLIEMWESVGIHSPKELIHELGFNARRINIVDLADVLEKQLKGLNDTNRTNFQSPHLVLLQANLTLYQSEIRCLKTVLEQMHAEREKLKCDVLEANNRATLLAQEVDDNHLRMEQNTMNQVKLLEHRHADILKDVQEQYTKDKEQLSAINQSLEERINGLEVEASKLKNDLLTAQQYSINVEKENVDLNVKITQLKRDNDVLNEQIGLLENEKQQRDEKEFEENEVLLAKLSTLQLENSQLKDRNDEMVSEIENLSSQVASLRNKMSSTPTTFHTLDQSMEENISIICEGVGIGAKRRSDCSPTKDVNLFGIMDGSPRLGKVRKFTKIKGENLDVPFTSSESGFDTEIDCFDSLSTSINESEEIVRLQAKVAFLEQLLIQNSVPIPVNEQDFEAKTSKDKSQLINRIKQLEKVIMVVQKDVKSMIETDCINCDNLKNVAVKLENVLINNTNKVTLNDACVQTDTSLTDKIHELETANTELNTKCNDLENCVELLRNEYEKCEDYWQAKVEEERQLFDAEQKLNTEKLNELLMKMKEYEEQYLNADVMDNRLPTIEETYNLEKQFTDLEQEFEDFKSQIENEQFLKDEEITKLKEKLSELAVKRTQVSEIGVQVVDETTDEVKLLEKMKNFTSYVIETTNRQPDEMAASPTTPKTTTIWNQNTDKKSEENSLTNSTSSLPIAWNFTNNVDVASTSSSLERNSTPCRPKRTRKHDKNLYKKSLPEKEVKKNDMDNFRTTTTNDWRGMHSCKNDAEQVVSVPVSALHNLTNRKNFLEQRVRQLQHCIRQQQFDKEHTIQWYFQHLLRERADLQNKIRIFQEKFDHQKRIFNEQLDKLERSDLLVKDLYVENSYLMARVQMLEQQCHRLTQYSNSSSV